MPDFNPPGPNFETRVRSSFAKEQVMKTIGIQMIKVSAREVHLEFPFGLAWTQHLHYVHAGIITTIADTACGDAAYKPHALKALEKFKMLLMMIRS